MSKNFALLSIGAALLLSLLFVDGSYAINVVTGKPPVDFMHVARMYGWTEGPLQIVGILLGAGLIALMGLGIRRMRHPRYGHQM